MCETIDNYSLKTLPISLGNDFQLIPHFHTSSKTFPILVTINKRITHAEITFYLIIQSSSNPQSLFPIELEFNFACSSDQPHVYFIKCRSHVKIVLPGSSPRSGTIGPFGKYILVSILTFFFNFFVTFQINLFFSYHHLL